MFGLFSCVAGEGDLLTGGDLYAVSSGALNFFL